MNDCRKQNIPLNKITTQRHNRKYSYADSINQLSYFTPRQRQISKQTQQIQYHQKQTHIDPQRYIAQLQHQLAQQKQKSKRIQQHTICQQTKVLEQIEILQAKFNQVENQKNQMKQILEQSQKQIIQYKKVKGVADAMVNMMEKVEGKNGDYHEAWRWIKKVVWEYQSIRKKGLQWKRAYDILAQQERQQQRNNTFSNESESISSQQQKQ